MRADLTKLLTSPGSTRLETMPGVTEEMILRSFEDVFYDMWTEITRIRGFSYQKVFFTVFYYNIVLDITLHISYSKSFIILIRF